MKGRVIRLLCPESSCQYKRFDRCLNTLIWYKIKIMTEPVYRRLECISNTFKQFYVVGRDEQGKTLWTIRERFKRSLLHTLLRLTKLRISMELILEMDGHQGLFILYRSAGIWIKRKCTLRDSTDILRVTLQYGFLSCNLLDQSGQPLGKIRFSNPTLIGKDQGILITQQGLHIARFTFHCLNFWDNRWYSEMEIMIHPERWEPIVVAIAALRLAEKQMR